MHWYVLCSSLFLPDYFLYKWHLFIISNAFSLFRCWIFNRVCMLSFKSLLASPFLVKTPLTRSPSNLMGSCSYTVDIRIVNVLCKWFRWLSSHIFDTRKIVILSGRDRYRKIIHLIQRYICPVARFQILNTVSISLLSSRTGW